MAMATDRLLRCMRWAREGGGRGSRRPSSVFLIGHPPNCVGPTPISTPSCRWRQRENLGYGHCSPFLLSANPSTQMRKSSWLSRIAQICAVRPPCTLSFLSRRQCPGFGGFDTILMTAPTQVYLAKRPKGYFATDDFQVRPWLSHYATIDAGITTSRSYVILDRLVCTLSSSSLLPAHSSPL